MLKHGCYSLTALALLTPFAWASDNEDLLGLDRIHVPALADVKVSAAAGQGVTFDGGDAFSLNIYNRVQVMWGFASLEGAPEVNTFGVPSARTKFSGHAFTKNTRFAINNDWAAGGLLDAYIEQDVTDNLIARAGAQKTLYGREATGSSGSLEFTERSLAARSFSGARSTGLVLQMSAADDKLHLHAGAFNTDTAGGLGLSGPGGLNADNELNYTLGVRYDINGDMGDTDYSQGDLESCRDWNASIGAGVWLGNEGPVVSGNDTDVTSFNVNGAFKGHGFHAIVEFFSSSSTTDTAAATDADATGFTLQGSYQLNDGLSVGARFSSVTIDTGGSQTIFPVGALLVGAGDVTEISFVANKYLNGHGRKIQADVTIQEVSPDGGGETSNLIFRVLATLQV